MITPIDVGKWFLRCGAHDAPVDGKDSHTKLIFSGAQLAEFAQLAYAKGLEDAAKAAEIRMGELKTTKSSWLLGRELITAIRALTLHGEERQDGTE